MTQFISIGKISRPHGFRGAFVATTELSKDSAFSYLKRVFIGSTSETAKEHLVESSDWMPKGWKLKVQGIDSDTQVKEIQRQEVFAQRQDLKDPSPNEYYVSDLVGMPAFEGDSCEQLGVFTHLSELGLQDGKVMQQTWHFKKTDGTEFSVPVVKRYVKGVDTTAKKIFLQNLSDFIED